MSAIDKQLKDASKDGKTEQVKSLLSQGGNPNWKDPNDVSK